MKSTSAEKVNDAKKELPEWQEEYDCLQALLPVEATIKRLDEEIVALDGKITTQRTQIDEKVLASEKVHHALDHLDGLSSLAADAGER